MVLFIKCFLGVPSRIQGATFADLEKDQKKLAATAWSNRKPIDQGGLLKFVFDKEYHAFNPDVINALHKAANFFWSFSRSANVAP
jgi:glutamate synthase (NADPH/NADH) large chain